MQELKKLEKEAKQAITKATSYVALNDVRVQFLGRKGKLSLFLRRIKDMSQDKRKTVGRKANELRSELEEMIQVRQEQFRKKERNETMKREWIDVTQPGKNISAGRLHPLTRTMREVTEIFRDLGFTVALGPDIETEWYNFDALHIPENHPSRDLWDTFWIKDSSRRKSSSKNRLLMRTHTSPVQVRYMEQHQPPFAIVAPGKVFRYEASDASHDIEFYQIEGLMVDADTSVAHLKYVINEFFSRLFSADIDIRLRASFFPFTEPSFEVDLRRKRGSKKYTEWMEIAGAGMVHPEVFSHAGINPKHWQGFAFGLGIDRILMLKHNIPDIRLLHSTDIRFLQQF